MSQPPPSAQAIIDQLVRESGVSDPIEYTIPSTAFRDAGHFLPKDKSVENDGPIYAASSTGRPADDECHLDLGEASGTYRVSAVPLWTAQDSLGANGENAVAAIQRPISVRKPRRKRMNSGGPTLFDDP